MLDQFLRSHIVGIRHLGFKSMQIIVEINNLIRVMNLGIFLIG